MTGWVFGWLLVVMAEVGELGSSGGTSSVLSPFIAMARRSRPSSMCACLAEEQRHAVAIAPWLYVQHKTRLRHMQRYQLPCFLSPSVVEPAWISDVESVEVVGFASYAIHSDVSLRSAKRGMILMTPQLYITY